VTDRNEALRRVVETTERIAYQRKLATAYRRIAPVFQSSRPAETEYYENQGKKADHVGDQLSEVLSKQIAEVRKELTPS
jgi:lipid A disaccharide synthetase